MARIVGNAEIIKIDGNFFWRYGGAAHCNAEGNHHIWGVLLDKRIHSFECGKTFNRQNGAHNLRIAFGRAVQQFRQLL